MRQEAKASPDSNKMTFIQSEELESLAVIANTLSSSSRAVQQRAGFHPFHD